MFHWLDTNFQSVKGSDYYHSYYALKLIATTIITGNRNASIN